MARADAPANLAPAGSPSGPTATAAPNSQGGVDPAASASPPFIELGDEVRTKFPVTDLCKGTMIVGDTGSGKTHFVKYFIESVIEQAPSMRNVLIIDRKGDLTDMVNKASRDDEAVRRFDALVEVDVVTFGQGVGAGVRCTLSPFPLLQQLEDMELPRRCTW